MRTGKITAAAIRVLQLSGWLATITLALADPLTDPDSLWKIVHGNCVPTQQSQGRPGECRLVDLAGRYAVLKDLRGDTRFLLLPTQQITGIESPVLLQAGAVNYWRAAWDARRFVEERAGRTLPRDMTGLAINSRKRSQNQLHIHIDCVQPDLRAALRQHEAEISEQWSRQPLLLAGHAYYALRLVGAQLETDPFQRLARRLADPGSEMGRQSLAVIGAEFSDGRSGFYLLDSPVGDHAATVDVVLDRACRVLQSRPG
jgi:CDP-diacylglycerol pyrophosphatase